jgi:hypothetical protein
VGTKYMATIENTVNAYTAFAMHDLNFEKSIKK